MILKDFKTGQKYKIKNIKEVNPNYRNCICTVTNIDYISGIIYIKIRMDNYNEKMTHIYPSIYPSQYFLFEKINDIEINCEEDYYKWLAARLK